MEESNIIFFYSFITLKFHVMNIYKIFNLSTTWWCLNTETVCIIKNWKCKWSTIELIIKQGIKQEISARDSSRKNFARSAIHSTRNSATTKNGDNFFSQEKWQITEMCGSAVSHFISHLIKRRFFYGMIQCSSELTAPPDVAWDNNPLRSMYDVARFGRRRSIEWHISNYNVSKDNSKT